MTIPPARTLRWDNPAQLYADVPEISAFTKNRPGEAEDALGYLERLRFSTTPEDAVTYTAFAAEPRFAIRWGLDTVRSNQRELSPVDQQFDGWIMQWLEYPCNETRWHAMQAALFERRCTAMVHLALAVGWSGGPLAPNDRSVVPAWRSSRAVNAAILTSIAGAGPQHRSVCLARALDLAAGLFRLY